MLLNLHIIGQKIYCDEVPFLATESKNYLECKFEFSTDWEGCIKTAIFRGVTGVPYCIEIEDDTCTVPYEVLTGNVFLISVFGILDDKRITTNTVDIYVKDSGYAEGETPPEPTPTVYEKILKELHSINTIQQEELDNKAGKTELANLSSELKKKVDSDTYSSDINGIRAEVSDLGDNIDTHTTDTDIHITADERTLWNTVSDKAEQSGFEELQAQADNNSSNITKNQRHITELYNQVNDSVHYKEFESYIEILQEDIKNVDEGMSNNTSSIEELQTQMGDIATILADIKADQEALINGGEE